MDRNYAVERWLTGKVSSPQFKETIQIYLLEREYAKMEILQQ